MISFEDLVDYLLPYGYIPAVVPEFKGITVGGSLQGLAAESTSFKYGYVHDAISSYEVIIGNGDVITCSEYINSDLYHSLPGSFGSLGLFNSKDKEAVVVYPIKDYLFRHDRGSFWMASYRIPQIIGRFMGKLLDSSSMFKLATALPWAFPKSVIVLQDFMLPRSNDGKL
eukprot:gene17056-22567_t